MSDVKLKWTYQDCEVGSSLLGHTRVPSASSIGLFLTGPQIPSGSAVGGFQRRRFGRGLLSEKAGT